MRSTERRSVGVAVEVVLETLERARLMTWVLSSRKMRLEGSLYPGHFWPVRQHWPHSGTALSHFFWGVKCEPKCPFFLLFSFSVMIFCLL